jgi:ankyrin repeat protein
MECLCIRQLSPFHEAARHDSISVLELFLERGADINSWGDVDQKGLREITHQGRETGSPLDRAAQIGAAESVTFLLQRGAKLDSAPDGLRFTALHHAMTGMWYHEKESRVSLNKSDRIVLGPKAKLRKLPADGNSVVIKLLVDHGADLRAKDYKGNEPLHIAAGSLDAEAIEFVLKEYRSLVDIDAPGILGWTPLQVAKNSGLFNDPERKERQEKTIATLKKYGARDNL